MGAAIAKQRIKGKKFVVKMCALWEMYADWKSFCGRWEKKLTFEFRSASAKFFPEILELSKPNPRPEKLWVANKMLQTLGRVLGTVAKWGASETHIDLIKSCRGFYCK